MRKLLLCLILAGCATTATEVKQEGTRLTMHSSNSPSVAAGCMARNIDNIGWLGLGTAVREIAGGFEVEIRSNISRRLLAYGEARPDKEGSSLTVWINAGDPPKVMANLTKGC